MVIRILLGLFIVISFSTLAVGQDKFCYRDSSGNLDCKDSIEEIPAKYQASAFFKPAAKTINTNLKQQIPQKIINEDPIVKKAPSSIDNNLPPAKNLEESSDKSESEYHHDDKKEKGIEIFVAKWCPHCKALEEFLKKRGLKYKKYDVETDEYGSEIYEKEGTIPVSFINGKTILGFDQRKFGEILDSELPY